MEKERMVKLFGMISLIIAVLGLTVAFSLLSKNLDIKGSSNLDPVKWGLKFKGLSKAKLYGDASVNSDATIDTDDETKIKNMNVVLNTPGDKIVYKVNLVNESTITAKIDSIYNHIDNLSNENIKKVLDFQVKYTDTDKPVQKGDIIDSGIETNLTITIYYSKEEITKSILSEFEDGLTINLDFKINFIQSDDKATITTRAIPADCKFTKKDTYSVGDEIKLCNYSTGVSQKFNVIEDKGSSIVMFAQENLQSDTGLQGKTTYYISFAPKDNGTYGYWTDSSGKLLSDYGASDYPVDVYDKNSSLHSIVEKYVSYIHNEIGKESATGRLITYNELIKLGCDYSTDKSCSNAPSWVYSTNYWTGTAGFKYAIYDVNVTNARFKYDYFTTASSFGIRPVIVIDKSEL